MKKKILNILFSWGSIPRDYFRKESLSSASIKYIINLPVKRSGGCLIKITQDFQKLKNVFKFYEET